MHRIRGISPAVAVSVGGSSRVVLIRNGVCDRRDPADARLVRCLGSSAD